MAKEGEATPCPRSAFRYDILYCWLNPTMSGAKGRKVEPHHLPRLPEGDDIASMIDTSHTSARTVLKDEGWGFLQGGLAMLVYAFAQTFMPVAMMMVIKCAEKQQTNDFNYLPPAFRSPEAMVYWIVLYVAMQCASAIANHWQMNITYHVGQRLRAKVIVAVFQKALRVDPKVRPSVGHTLNLMSTDAQRFLEASPFLHKLWASPLQIFLASVILLALVDASAFYGILVLVLVVPISRHCAQLLSRYRSTHLMFQDQRVRMCVELLEGIRCIKFFAWERPYLDRVFKKRAEELFWARRESTVYGASMIVTVLAPVYAFAATLIAFILQGDAASLTATRVFGTLALLNALRFAIMDLGAMLATIVALYTSWHRLKDFLNLDEAGVPVAELEDGLELELSKSTFSCLEEAKECFRLQMGPLQVRRGELVLVLGKVGSGKTTLLQGILGEMVCTGSVAVRGKIAYCAQQPWIRNESLRDNVLFGEEMDMEWYLQVLDACGLGPDLKQLPAQDFTEIGERGVTLSGGQKQRVALARAVYQRCPLMLLDDVFSALDAQTSRHILQALLGETGLLKHQAIILASHSTALAEVANQVLLLGTPDSAEESKVLFQGKWKDLLEQKPLLELIGQADVEVSDTPDVEEREKISKAMELSLGSVQPSMMKEEDHSASITWRCVKMYLQSSGGWTVVLIFFLSSALERLVMVGLDWWLARWTEEASPDELDLYLGVYLAFLGAVSVLACITRLLMPFTTIWAGAALFKKLALRVVRAPIRWWDTTPLGRVLNRFSFDTDNVDTTLITKMYPAIVSLSWCVGALAVMTGTFWPWSLLFIPLPVVLYFWLFQFSRKSIRQFQQLDSVSRSPIQSVYTEVLNGIVSCRAFACESRYQQRLSQLVDANSAAVLTFNTANRWLGVRVELLGAFISALVGLGFFALREQVPAGLVGMCFIWTTNLAVSLGFNCIFSSQAEACFTSVERITEYALEVPCEGEHQDLDTWRSPVAAEVFASSSQPLLMFQKVSLRYQPDLPLALNSVSFTLNRKDVQVHSVASEPTFFGNHAPPDDLDGQIIDLAEITQWQTKAGERDGVFD
ncbi:unnamed protein product [Effrenium voratum]|nr:unnamed protein product [Effrenium voratum]